ncbi:hypothetical protein HMI54_005448 [Coelomomyces lativittatus]|nr:hypothetical protein HMI54_005448 [Coelomomyces lativittatus]
MGKRASRSSSPSKQTEKKKKGTYLVDQIPETEKWKLIESSGVLKHMASQQRLYFLPSLFYSIGLCFFYILLESMVHQQFNEEHTWTQMATICLSNVFPFLWIVVYITHRYVEHDMIQYGMTLVGSWCGIRMFQYIVLQQSTYGEMLRTPGIATVWV